MSISMLSSSKVFIGGLSYRIDDHQLKQAFDNFGQVSDAKVIVDRKTGKSKGFGFVDYSDTEGASVAISQMDRQELYGSTIFVRFWNVLVHFLRYFCCTFVFSCFCCKFCVVLIFFEVNRVKWVNPKLSRTETIWLVFGIRDIIPELKPN
jgi:RNA recognition motif-containing protein